MSKTTINVIKPFVLTLDDATRVVFKRGTHQVDEATAAHWYVQAHIAPADEPDAADAATAAELAAATAELAEAKLANQDQEGQIADLKKQLADLTKDKPAEPAKSVEPKPESTGPVTITPSPAASEFASDIAKAIAETGKADAPPAKKGSK